MESISLAAAGGADAAGLLPIAELSGTPAW